MAWPLAAVVIVIVLVIGAMAFTDRDIDNVFNAILLLLVALGLAELREIKSQTNGSQSTLMEQNRQLMDELAQYRREAARITDRALDSAPLGPVVAPPPAPVVFDPNDPTMATTTTTTTTTSPSRP